MIQELGRPAPDSEILRGLAREYIKRPPTPTLVNDLWGTILETAIQTRRLDIPVPNIECDRTQKELGALKKKKGIWVPETELTYYQLGIIFPETQSYALQENILIEDKFKQDAKGIDVEGRIDAPNRNTTEENLEKRFKYRERKGMRLVTYILASQLIKILTGHYLDEGSTSSILLGTSINNRVIKAHFRVDGDLGVSWSWRLDPKDHNSRWGGRSEGIIEKA